MIFTQVALTGAFVIQLEPSHDQRGYFARTWCEREFANANLPTRFVQASISHNRKRGTLRGMHLQRLPSQEAKLVRCTRGRIYDVIVDVRPGSPTYMQHLGIELSADAHNALYVPPTVLHGFQTLEDETDVLYQMTDFYAPELAYGARWNDAAFGIRWPITTGLVMNDRDANYPDFDPDLFAERMRACEQGTA